MRIVRLLFILLFLPGVTLAQKIDMVITTAPVDQLSITDVDFINSTTPKWLFSIELKGSPPGQAITATMRVFGDIFLANGETFPNSSYLETKNFSFTTSRIFTNLDLRNSVLRMVYRTDPAAKKRLEEIALPSGRLPAGRYAFRVEVTVQAGQTTVNTFAFVLTNPSSLSLLFPFDGDPSVNLFPLFQWQFDGRRSTISIYEKLPGQSSAEEAASGTPHLVQDVTVTSFQYPSAGVRALEQGKTYVWYVAGHVRSSGGMDQLIKSPLRTFTVSTTGLPAGTSVLDDLERALDPKYKPLFDQIRTEGLASTGSNRLNGNPISSVELVRLINLFRMNPDAVQSARVE